MAFRDVTKTNSPVIDSIADVSISNGAAAIVEDMIMVDSRQAALMYRFGSPPMSVSTYITDSEATIQIPTPPAVEYIILGILAAGDGGITTVSSGGSTTKTKHSANVDAMTDEDTNGTRFHVRTHPDDALNSYTGLEHASWQFADELYADATTDQKVRRRLRVNNQAHAMADDHEWGNETLRLVVPSGVIVYGIFIEPIYRQRPI